MSSRKIPGQIPIQWWHEIKKKKGFEAIEQILSSKLTIKYRKDFQSDCIGMHKREIYYDMQFLQHLIK